MSPPGLRRYRADRQLRRDFVGLRPTVLRAVTRRLLVRGMRLDPSDLEACYAQAWQGLYATLLSGQEVHNPAGWLVTVAFRRAVEEARVPAPRGAVRWEAIEAPAPDHEARLDDLSRLRALFEAMRLRLDPRECQAASLCYLQGLTRAQAAERMGISEPRMRKLMDGLGAREPGVAAKMDRLLALLSGGQWCDEQASLMRALAFGLLDPGSERHRLAVLHQRGCPACRAFVASLRGLAAALPPLGLPLAAAGSAAVAGAGAGAAAGGGWLLAGGSLSAKFAAGCLLALGLGAGCVALSGPPTAARQVRHAHHRSRSPLAVAHGQPAPSLAAAVSVSGPRWSGVPLAARRSARLAATARRVAVPAASSAPREFAVEPAAQREFSSPRSSAASGGPARTAVATGAPVASQMRPSPSAAGTGRATREFGFE